MKSIFNATYKYIKNYFNLFLIYGFLSVLFGFVSLFAPYISGRFIDKLIVAEESTFIYKYVLVLSIIMLLSIVLGYIVNRIYVYIQARMCYEFNEDVIRKLHHTDLQRILSYDSAYLTQRINNDCNSIITFCISVVQDSIVNIIKFIFPLVIVIRLNPVFGVVVLLSTVTYFIIYMLFKNFLFKVNLAFIEKKSIYFNDLNLQLKYAKFIKLHVLSKQLLKRLDNSFAKMIETILKLQSVSYAFSSLDKIVSSLVQILVFIIGGISVINKQMTIGDLTIIMTYFGFIISSGTYFFSTSQSIQKTLPCVYRINELYNLKISKNGNVVIQSIDSIKIDRLSFKYHNSDKKILNDFSFNFTKGKIYMISGDNGCGKSTLINIIVGLYDNDFKGNIYYNDINSKLLDLELLRKTSISICEQDTVLLKDSIKSNLELFNSKSSRERLSYIKEKLQINGNSILDNEKAILYEDTNNISGGEKQLISLVRAFSKDFDLLILDEPSSALDFRKTEKLKNFLREISLNKIVIIVSHEKGYEDIADEIIYLETKYERQLNWRSFN